MSARSDAIAVGAGSLAPSTRREERKVIFASSLGTVFEWYDFYLYGSLAAIISAQFFSGVNPTAGFIFALLAFAAGFAVRPFGAIVFGRLGDLVGRKYTFLITMFIMGLSTFAVGLLPSYAQMKERFESRLKKKGPAERLFAKLTGLDVKMEQYQLGERFVNEVVAQVGVAGMNKVWQGPHALPTLEEVREPRRWVERVAL